MSTTSPMTAAQLLNLADDGNRYELVAGELRMMSPGSWAHSEISLNIASLLREHVKKHRLGKVLSNDPGFLIKSDPDTVIAPDVAYIAKGNIPPDLAKQGYWPGAPDMAVEVLLPNDRITTAEEKIDRWLAAGCRLVWFVNPRASTIQIYTAKAELKTKTIDDEIDGGEVLPGFRCSVAELLEIG